MTPSIIPAGHSLMGRDAATDPFTADQPVESFTGPTRNPGDIQDSLMRPQAEIGEPSVVVPQRRRSRRLESSMRKAGSEPTEIRSESRPETATIQPRIQNELFSSASRDTEPRQARNDALKKRPEDKAKTTLLSPAQEIEETFQTDRRTLRLDAQTHVVAAATLEPRAPENSRPEVPPLDEPRLVIGQLRVDVIPAPPGPARDAVRKVTRVVGSNQSRGVSRPISRLRFGLRQM